MNFDSYSLNYLGENLRASCTCRRDRRSLCAGSFRPRFGLGWAVSLMDALLLVVVRAVVSGDL